MHLQATIIIIKDKGRVSVLNQAPRHEDALGGRCSYSATHSWPPH